VCPGYHPHSACRVAEEDGATAPDWGCAWPSPDVPTPQLARTAPFCPAPTHSAVLGWWINGGRTIIAVEAAGLGWETVDHSKGEIKHQGAIDVRDIRDVIKRVMEGGEKAFTLRRQKYGF